MTRIIKYLSKREQILFEKMFRSVEAFYPEWRMENIFHSKTREHFSLHEQLPKYLWSEKNQRNIKCEKSRESVALHEAGHTIVMVACHKMVAKAVTLDDADTEGRLGYVLPEGAREFPDKEYTPVDVADIPPDPLIRSWILIDAAGFVAEHVYAKRRPVNYHEKLLVYFQTRYLDRRDKTNPLFHWNYFMKWCGEILKTNERIFKQAANDMMTNDVLSERMLRRVHEETKREDAGLFFLTKNRKKNILQQLKNSSTSSTYSTDKAFRDSNPTLTQH